MKNRISYENLLEIQKECGQFKEIFQLQHAYRINGVIDIYKNVTKNDQYLLFDIKSVIYHRFETKTQAILFLKKFVSEHEQVKTFDNRQNGQITYKALVKNIKKSDFRSEEYNWNAYKRDMSTDHLYFISDGNYRIKIGRSVNPQKRLKSLQTGSPTQLKIEFIIWHKGCIEKIMHNCFRELRLEGEWFTYSARFDDFFKFVKNWYKENKTENKLIA